MTLNQAQIAPPHPPVERVAVLTELWSDFKKLKQIYTSVDTHRRPLTPELKYQVYILQVRSQVGKSILHGLRDSDLDEINLRLERLENQQSKH